MDRLPISCARKRVEYASPRFRSYAFPRISDFQLHVITLRQLFRDPRQPVLSNLDAPHGHADHYVPISNRLGCVHYEIHHDLPDRCATRPAGGWEDPCQDQCAE